MMVWILIAVVSVALIVVGLKDSDHVTLQGAVYGVTLLFLVLLLWIWVSG